MNIVLMKPMVPEPDPGGESSMEAAANLPQMAGPNGTPPVIDAAMRFVFCSQGERGVTYVPDYSGEDAFPEMKRAEKALHPSHEASFTEANCLLKEYFADARSRLGLGEPADPVPPPS